METNLDLAPPPRNMYLKELRAALDIARLPGAIANSYLQKAESVRHNKPVILIPGFGAGDRATAPFRQFLNKAGYACQGWKLGRNLAGLNLEFDASDISWDFDRSRAHNGELGVPYLCDLMVRRTRMLAEQYDEAVALVGWSLGGCIAREVARDLPESVRCVVTMGTPVHGGPKYTAGGERLAQRGIDLDWIELEASRRESRPITCPVTSIVSRSDGIVGYAAAIDRSNTSVEHIHVDASHLGMAFNKNIWNLTLEALDRTVAE